MNWLNILGISFGLAMDAFAVSVAVGLGVRAVTGRHVFRIGFHFGLFQFLMPVLGWIVGRGLAVYIRGFDHWIAFGLLAAIGLRMLKESCHESPLQDRSDPSRGWSLVLLSIATSIDAMAAGLSMAFLQVSIWLPSVVIGIVTASLSTAGIAFAGQLGRHWGRWAALIGGSVLILIGLRILVTDLMTVHGITAG